ncbi:MAG: class I SAM-dependent methyltransferase, partial [Anaerolineales bacterium]
GKNIPYYPALAKLTAVDLSEGMMAKAVSRAERLNRVIDFQLMDVESLRFPDDRFDAAVATFVFCSVPDPIKGLKELSRVVKPGGDIWLLDHVRVNKPIIGPLMDLFNPLVVRMMGANINRRTMQNVHQSGLKIHNVTNLKGELVQLIQAGPDQNQSRTSQR